MGDVQVKGHDFLSDWMPMIFYLHETFLLEISATAYFILWEIFTVYIGL